MLKKLSLLLLLAVNALGIQLQGQTALIDSTCRVNLSCQEYDFYAQSLVENKGLKVDTTINNEQLRTYGTIITNIDKQLSNSQEMLVNKDIIIDIHNKDFARVSADYTKQQKRTKFYQQTTLTFIATTLVMLILVLFK